ncbi:subtilisin-like serine protease [Podila humilis]|nr:subtilisin-like serine protease [Podila humilis]
MKRQTILALSAALASSFFIATVSAKAEANNAAGQATLAVPVGQQHDAPSIASTPPEISNNNLHENLDSDIDRNAYFYDTSKASTRGYDVDGRQEVVNIGPNLRTTADGQTQSRTGPQGRQRGTVLPHKYIVRLKNGADLDTFNLQSQLDEHNRLTHTDSPDGRQKHEVIPNQVDHEYDFGIWKGYAGQFSSDFLKELESHDEVEYVEEDTLMWAWDTGRDDELNQEAENSDSTLSRKNQQHKQNEKRLVYEEQLGAVMSGNYGGEALINGQETHLSYYSLKAPSWGLSRIAQHNRDLSKDYTYASTAGHGVDVYIIDSGVFEEHSDFGGRASNVANFVPHEPSTDTCGHGTHVAGIVGGRRYGVAKGVRINAVKVLDAQGQGSTSQVLAGINFVIRHAFNNPNTRKVINMSLGGQFSRPVNDAVRVAVNRYNLPFFVAAGNSGDDACQYSPAGVDEAFAVGGSDRSDKVGWYSCTGSCVSLFAPGSGIQSTWIKGRKSAHMLDGTSMAAPHVAGVAALFLSSGMQYTSARSLYDDIKRHSTRGVINGLKSYDRTTSRDLLYNKLEELSASYTFRSMDDELQNDMDNEGEESAQDVKKEKKKKGKGRHRH